MAANVLEDNYGPWSLDMKKIRERFTGKKKKNQPERPEIKEATEGTFQNHESGQKSHGTWPGFDPGEEETGASQSRGRGSEGKAELISDCASEVAEKMYSYPLFTEAY